MNTHTPGPWEIKLSRDDEGTLCHIGTPDKIARCGQHVCQINGWGFDYDADKEQQANARLIAAAPDMLEALEEAIKCGMVPSSSVKDGGAARHSRQVAVADMIRAAIAKATGN